MTYAKPEVVTLGSAVDEVQLNPFKKGTLRTGDSVHGPSPYNVISAYEADE